MSFEISPIPSDSPKSILKTSPNYVKFSKITIPGEEESKVKFLASQIRDFNPESPSTDFESCKSTCIETPTEEELSGKIKSKSYQNQSLENIANICCEFTMYLLAKHVDPKKVAILMLGLNETLRHHKELTSFDTFLMLYDKELKSRPNLILSELENLHLNETINAFRAIFNQYIGVIPIPRTIF